MLPALQLFIFFLKSETNIIFSRLCWNALSDYWEGFDDTVYTYCKAFSKWRQCNITNFQTNICDICLSRQDMHFVKKEHDV